MKIQMDVLGHLAGSDMYATDVSTTSEQEIRTTRLPNAHTGTRTVSARTDVVLLKKNYLGMHFYNKWY